ncbi:MULTISPECIES: prepilin-type N-terminal cleavage/methylation domain-containing protein [Alteromonadaceae]|uniref:Prepilin-type N-terminal cleavage/methylation domain-containing protein n=1 Tax=Brumicola blandensis TaxID=3075611 RepID=A0AAW8QYK5_9ALTE|nr:MULTISPECIES: prepilin-type N-terminal cleavage/methylation domain-containing protein [unclassified Alteromonas]MDT0582243.1 prepilin-type N-terminal cleavage/methylation domain-containing protein [Alteromonas sp. W409]MDT0627801.1 prepilin-type N-terminal cleavage/methylation domain-containing protein [Alteromonas sp. W364]
MKNQMTNQKGFTLIELIIVIVILGILAVTAAPRFIDLQTDARAQTLEGVKAALQGSSQLVYAKAAIAGVQSSATAVNVTVNGAAVSTVNGYPNAAVITSAANVVPFLDLSTGDFAVINVDTTLAAGEFIIAFAGETATNNCYVRYVNAGANAAPGITTVATGC